ncbi:MAG: PRC-barrel domain-containing protein [Proteobacteria bacterium]|nr:PRC-barrel domain-containing protein [Pseudomonadota bacterium]
MKIKILALASVAVVALSGTAFAKAHHHHQSANAKADAQEAVITQQLNQQQLSSPGVVPTVQASNESSSQMAMNSTSSNAPDDRTAKTDAMAANDTSKSSDAMQKDSTAPKTELGKATTAAGNEIDQASMAKNPVTEAELKSAVPLSDVSQETLKTAEVKNRNGEALGEVNSVKVDKSGKVAAVNAEVGGFLGVGERTVALNANNLVYLKDRNLIVTSMTKDQIKKLPSIAK